MIKFNRYLCFLISSSHIIIHPYIIRHLLSRRFPAVRVIVCAAITSQYILRFKMILLLIEDLMVIQAWSQLRLQGFLEIWLSDRAWVRSWLGESSQWLMRVLKYHPDAEEPEWSLSWLHTTPSTNIKKLT